MALNVFHSLFQDRDPWALHSRLQQLEHMNMDLHIPWFEEEAGYPLELPFETVLDALDDSYGDDGEMQYWEEILLFIAERTTPTRALIERFRMLQFASLRALEELLRRYDGPKFYYCQYTTTRFAEMLLGYSLLDLESTSTRHRVFPIEGVILSYAFHSLEKTEAEDLVALFERYGSPSPRRELLFSIVQDEEYSRLKEILK